MANIERNLRDAIIKYAGHDHHKRQLVYGRAWNALENVAKNEADQARSQLRRNYLEKLINTIEREYQNIEVAVNDQISSFELSDISLNPAQNPAQAYNEEDSTARLDEQIQTDAAAYPSFELPPLSSTSIAPDTQPATQANKSRKLLIGIVVALILIGVSNLYYSASKNTNMGLDKVHRTASIQEQTDILLGTPLFFANMTKSIDDGTFQKLPNSNSAQGSSPALGHWKIMPSADYVEFSGPAVLAASTPIPVDSEKVYMMSMEFEILPNKTGKTSDGLYLKGGFAFLDQNKKPISLDENAQQYFLFDGYHKPTNGFSKERAIISGISSKAIKGFDPNARFFVPIVKLGADAGNSIIRIKTISVHLM